MQIPRLQVTQGNLSRHHIESKNVAEMPETMKKLNKT